VAMMVVEQKVCLMTGCGQKSQAKGLCGKHYMQNKRRKEI